MSLKVLQAIKPCNPLLLPSSSSLLTRINSDLNQKRTVIYFDRNTGKRHTEPNAAQRFYKLDWGGWIRTKAGRSKRQWKKPWYISWYTKQHMFCHDPECEDLEKLIAPMIKAY